MADATNLIHAGLPWNNPLKITVKADLYISLLVINRGLLNLLSNDYYLDLKSLRINQYIVDFIDPHVNDRTIHWTEENIIDLINRFLNGLLGSFIEGFGLIADTVYVIPISTSLSYVKNLNRIQNIIDSCPKNLNGNTAIFALTPVITSNDYPKSISQYLKYLDDNITTSYVLYEGKTDIDIKSRSINLNSFYGGTLILLGNKYFTCSSSKDSKILTVKESKLFLLRVQKELLTTQERNIIIKGNGNNNSCSIVSFNNCLCDTFIWNLGLQIYNYNGDDERDENLPQKSDMALFFPANLLSDTIIGSARNIRATAVNKLDFSSVSILLRSTSQTLSGTVVDNPTTLSTIHLKDDYLKLEGVHDAFRQTFFGNYINNTSISADPLYAGASICFWMSGNFQQNNINEVPILYSVNNEGDGFYIGLLKVANIKNFNIDPTNYVLTSFASKKRNDLNNRWLFWSIDIEKSNDLGLSSYYMTISYADATGETVPVLPNRLINNENSVLINLPQLNFGNPIYVFGNPDIQYEVNLRNVLLFNRKLTTENIRSLAYLGIEDVYNLNDNSVGKTFENKMKGTIYAYNCTSVNVIECNLLKVIS